MLILQVHNSPNFDKLFAWSRKSTCADLHKELGQFRRQAVALGREGISIAGVVRSMDISRTALFIWLAQYRSGGLDIGKRGERNSRFDTKAIERLCCTLTNDQLKQWKLPFLLPYSLEIKTIEQNWKVGHYQSRTTQEIGAICHAQATAVVR